MCHLFSSFLWGWEWMSEKYYIQSIKRSTLQPLAIIGMYKDRCGMPMHQHKHPTPLGNDRPSLTCIKPIILQAIFQYAEVIRCYHISTGGITYGKELSLMNIGEIECSKSVSLAAELVKAVFQT